MENLVELVADEGDGFAFGGHGGTQHGEQLLGLLRGEHRRRFVEDDDVRVSAQALDDLDTLAEPGGEVAHEGIRIEPEPVALADVADQVARRPAVEPAALAEGDVLPDDEFVDEAEVLVDHADTEGGSGLRIVDLAHRAVDGDLAAVGRHETDEDPHQRRLTGTVLPEDSVHLAAVEIEVDAVASGDVAEAFGDVADGDGGRSVAFGDRPRQSDVHRLNPW